MRGGLLSQQQHTLHIAHIGRVNQCCVRESALLFGCFFGEDVAFESVLPLDFTCSGQRKALLCTGVGFHFRHGSVAL